MEVITTIAGLRAQLDATRAGGEAVGFVPTMGALHRGHLSLVETAAAEAPVVVTSIFVNPLQFGAGEDLAAYPRDLDADLALAEAAGTTVAFAPSVEEMYPHPVATTVAVAGVTEGFEGASRPTHFAGVATVVTKLLGIVGACSAHFGEKDYQQLLLVRRLVADLSLPVRVVGGPTVREPDGLAMSSRNRYLTDAERADAPVLFRALTEAAERVRSGERDPEVIRDALAGPVAATPTAELDYAAAVDADTLADVKVLAGEVRLLVAARFGRARLLDNVGVLAD